MDTLEQRARLHDANLLDSHSSWIGALKRFCNSALFICLCAVLVRLAFVLIVTPLTEAPDEHHHLWVIQFLGHNLRLPTAADVQSGGTDALYGSMPQIGYVPHAVLSAIFSGQHPIFFARLGSLVMGVVTVLAGFFAGKELFPDRLLLARALPWLMVFHPQFAFVNSYCNNDAAANAICAWIIYLMILNLKSGPTLKRCAIMGCMMGLVVLCKYSGLALVPGAVLSVVAAAWLHGTSVGACFSCLLVLGATSTASCGWWFWRNAHEYGTGDILGIKTCYQTFSSNFHRPANYYQSPLKLVSDKGWWRLLTYSYWGIFGYMNRWMWRPIYFIYIGLAIAAVCGWLKSRAVAFRLTKSSRFELVTPSIWIIFSICVVVNFIAILNAQFGGPQGRYFFVCEIPILALWLEGMSRLGPNLGRSTVIAFVAFNVCVCVGALFMLFRLYGFPTTL